MNELIAAAQAVVEEWRLTWQVDEEGQPLSFGVGDLSACPYNLRGREGSDPNGICNMGCRDEPACHTCRPSDGWPMERLESALEQVPMVTVEKALVNELMTMFADGTTHADVYYAVESFYRQQMLAGRPTP